MHVRRRGIPHRGSRDLREQGQQLAAGGARAPGAPAGLRRGICVRQAAAGARGAPIRLVFGSSDALSPAARARARVRRPPRMRCIPVKGLLPGACSIRVSRRPAGMRQPWPSSWPPCKRTKPSAQGRGPGAGGTGRQGRPAGAAGPRLGASAGCSLRLVRRLGTLAPSKGALRAGAAATCSGRRAAHVTTKVTISSQVNSPLGLQPAAQLTRIQTTAKCMLSRPPPGASDIPEAVRPLPA
jgi:hypothetical protein